MRLARSLKVFLYVMGFVIAQGSEAAQLVGDHRRVSVCLGQRYVDDAATQAQLRKRNDVTVPTLLFVSSKLYFVAVMV